MNSIKIIKSMRCFFNSILFVVILPLTISCADNQFENDEQDINNSYSMWKSFTMRLITMESLQGKWYCDNSQITFDDNNFTSTGSIGNINGKFVITGNTIRVYNEKKNQRLGYFPVVAFNQFLTIRYNSHNYIFKPEGYNSDDDIYNPDDNNDNPNDNTPIIPLDKSGFYGTWSVSAVVCDGQQVYMDVDWLNTRLVLNENGTFSANYWLGIVEKTTDGIVTKIPIGGQWTIDNERNIYLEDKTTGNIYKYQYISADIKKYLKYKDPNTGEEVWYEKITMMKYKVEKEGHVYVVTFYPS